MRIVLFAHSLVSDWSHGNAHFLRGLMRALTQRGHSVVGVERWRNWSTDSLMQDHGAGSIVEFSRLFADLEIQMYGGWEGILPRLEELTRGADLVLVHEFNEPELVGTLGLLRHRRKDFLLLFHDTHHRAASVPWQTARANLQHYDGVLAYGESLAAVYRRDFGQEQVWTFHEAADTTSPARPSRPTTFSGSATGETRSGPGRSGSTWSTPRACCRSFVSRCMGYATPRRG